MALAVVLLISLTDIFPVKKKIKNKESNKKWKTCNTYQLLNDITMNDKHVLPNIGTDTYSLKCQNFLYCTSHFIFLIYEYSFNDTLIIVRQVRRVNNKC